MSEPETTNKHVSVYSNPQQEVLEQLERKLDRLSKLYSDIKQSLLLLEEFVTVCTWEFKIGTVNKVYTFHLRTLYKARTWEYICFCKEFPSLQCPGKSTSVVSKKMKEMLWIIVEDLENSGEIVPQ